MAFPLASETPPTLSLYQFQFNGYTFGYNSPLKLTKIDGLDLPTIRTGDSPRPRDHGSFTGLDLMAEREVTIEGELGTDGVSFGHALKEAARALKSTGMTELPLYFNHPIWGNLAMLSRVRKRQLPIDITFALGQLAKTTVMFAASDPRAYGATVSTVIKATVPTTALAFPLKFPLNFGGGSYVATGSIDNTGDEECRPRIILEECNGPTIASVTTGQALGFNIEIPAGAKLVLDTDIHSALYYPASEPTVAYDVMDTIVPGSEWWNLPAETTTTVSFLSGTGSTAGQATIEWAPAYTL